MKTILAFLSTIVLSSNCAQAQNLPIFDAHIHFSHDAASSIATTKVIELMRQAGLRKALVSSSDDEGTQKLLQAAPDLIIPSLRPYRTRSDTGTWTKEPQIITYLEQRLARYRYAAIGEFHLYGADADSPVPRKMVELAKKHKLILHAHSDAEAVDRLFKQWPEATIIWAHSGFDRPDAVIAMLAKHPGLYADLAYRSDQASSEWTQAFKSFPDRFMVGTDTFTPERIFYIPEHAQFSRSWLKALPNDVAEKIAYKNGEALLAKFWTVPNAAGKVMLDAAKVQAQLYLPEKIQVGKPFDVKLSLSNKTAGDSMTLVKVDASMPEHKHGMNYRPKVESDPAWEEVIAKGLVFHMPGRWQIEIAVNGIDASKAPWQKAERLFYDIQIK